MMLSEIFTKLSEEIERLIVEIKKLETEKRTDISIWIHAEKEYHHTIRLLKDEVKTLTAEVERLVRSRNRWGQKYNKLLSAVRTETAYGVYAAARDEYRRVITEQAAEIEKLRNDVRLAVMSDSKECTAISEVNARLTAENERLRAALREIIGWLEDPEGGSHEDDMREATRIACTALTQEDSDGR